MLFRQVRAAIYIRGLRQRIVIKNHSGIAYKKQRVPVVVRREAEANACYFSVYVKNETKDKKVDIKVTVKPQSIIEGNFVNAKVLGVTHSADCRIMTGGAGLNIVTYDIPLLHPFAEHHFGLTANTNEWPEVDIVCEDSIWNGRICKMDIVLAETEFHEFPKKLSRG